MLGKLFHVLGKKQETLPTSYVLNKYVKISENIKYSDKNGYKGEMERINGVNALSSMYLQYTCGWLYQNDINYNRLKLALQYSLLLYPYLSSTITLKNKELMLNYDNNGIRYNIAFDPDVSILNDDILNRLEKNINGNEYFEDEYNNNFIINGNESLLSVQLTYLGRNDINQISMENGKCHGGCVLTFNMNQCLCDTYSFYNYIKCVSDMMNLDEGNIQNLIDNYDVSNIVPKKDKIELKLLENNEYDITSLHGFQKYFNEVLIKQESIPYQRPFSKYSTFTTMILNQDTKAAKNVSTVFWKYINLDIEQQFIDALKEDYVNIINEESDIPLKCDDLSDFQLLTAHFAPIFGKYTSKDGILSDIVTPFNLRDKYGSLTNKDFGNLTWYNFFEMDPDKERFNITNDINICDSMYSNDADSMKSLNNHIYYSMLNCDYNLHKKQGPHINIWDQLRNKQSIWDDLSSYNLYENYTFGTNNVPLYFIPGNNCNGNGSNGHTILNKHPHNPNGGKRILIKMANTQYNAFVKENPHIMDQLGQHSFLEDYEFCD